MRRVRRDGVLDVRHLRRRWLPEERTGQYQRPRVRGAQEEAARGLHGVQVGSVHELHRLQTEDRGDACGGQGAVASPAFITNPSPLISTLTTGPVCPTTASPTCPPISTSHTCTLSSHDLDTTRLPSPLIATQSTPAL
ncbi:unnamed protein product [Chondrus crispus]|uniref:Uncharacterized protein n=1 Tax=Chondrus crispus TaxID=2769 RepID=R7QGF7_CHOCR|nr:unnamed protein product [Chondrus crispus]CDF36526.1 unnamed protein product [Chondrus crispus]|eukprot:XP_005716345.1 unnamed protein product [Chondrus crispus]